MKNEKERRTPSWRRAEAEIFRLAAKLMEDGHAGCGCCFAISEAGGDGYLPHGKHAKKMGLVYPEGMDGGWGDYPMWTGESGPRILALCFMAAMVEAGDA